MICIRGADRQRAANYPYTQFDCRVGQELLQWSVTIILTQCQGVFATVAKVGEIFR